MNRTPASNTATGGALSTAMFLLLSALTLSACATPTKLSDQPTALLTPCPPLQEFTTGDQQDVVATTVQNAEAYKICSDRQNGAAEWIRNLYKEK